ncbi:hypothetical protein [Acidisoma cladoniae]|uniref:hypothetical protein n=1 Tax=Acidisoma cladoniae TaxID=3040935 RepID=UPI00254D57FD|nr:hypothetical protein [Acidisoma sp. PAMC 29798]
MRYGHRRAPSPADWLAIIERSDADLAAGRIVPGDVVMREFAETLARMEAKAAAATRRKALPRR